MKETMKNGKKLGESNTEQTMFIRINQLGYASGLPVQIALLSDVASLDGIEANTAKNSCNESRLEKQTTLILTDTAGNEVKKCTIGKPSYDEASGDCVRLVNIGVLPEGEYYIEFEGQKREISVKKDPWQKVTDALIKGLYYQRCGCELEEKYAGKFTHKACHTAPAIEWDNREVKKTVIGGWHDAGDYGKYVGPGAVTVAHMIYAHMLCEKGCSDSLNIPESGNGVPDILNEARYELEWMLKMQRKDGAFYHKLTKAQFAPFIMPEDDHEQEYLMPVSHCATGAACACLALAYRVYKKYDAEFAEKLLSSALLASKWIDDNPEFVPYTNPEGVRTGWYGDKNFADEQFWAACELYASTGESKYKDAAEKLYQDGLNITSYGWADVSGLGAICCLFVLKDSAGDILYGSLKEKFIEECGKIAKLTEESGYGTALPADRYIWGSILSIMSNAISLILHGMLTGDDKYRAAALLQWNYALGLNALDISFITGFGEKSVKNPHHRPSGADGIDEPVPGLISGGPNKCFPYQQNRERFEGVPAAKCFLDETPSADTNEIAIYWNSPAIFVGAYFASECKQ
ncbi:MAG: glycoside hydrolase family 9 protein [Lachnospiraceae bacterium]|nr:glycoside hydrolase family 9 protein [Lachnospiraceae bacterium]